MLSPQMLVFACVVGVVAGFVKGAVGFAMPMIMISGLGSFLAPDVALAALIVPTVVSNLWQASRGGLAATVLAMRQFGLYLAIVLVFIGFSAQLVTLLPGQVLLLFLGVPVTLFAASQLLGWQLRFRPENRRRVEVITASVAGFIGGVSGVWGPPTVAFLTALETPKADQMRIQGVVYGLGAVVLFGAHLRSGILNAETMPLSIAMVLPALAGMAVGFRAGDRMDQQKFRRATLAVLVVAGLNLVRRGLMG
ncbi:MAG: sulfite exporter TauE/SafE family protein [Rhodobacteraceae bacterium]|nr:sulfite exporter TauE/SafE family protein [Paracoccaceae bacterium]